MYLIFLWTSLVGLTISLPQHKDSVRLAVCTSFKLKKSIFYKAMDLVSFKWRLSSNSPVTKPLQQWECHMQRGPTAAGIDGSSRMNTTGKAPIVAIAFIFSFVFHYSYLYSDTCWDHVFHLDFFDFGDWDMIKHCTQIGDTLKEVTSIIY